MRTMIFILLVILAAPGALAQRDLTGNWSPPRVEDRLECGPGPALADFLGLPMNEAGRQYISTYEQSRDDLDGRARTSFRERAAYLMGFSTAEWVGNKLRVRTTHIKQGWHLRNGLPSSDRMELIEYFARYGDVMTHITVPNDPDFLAEPMVKSQSFRLNEETGANWLWRISGISRV